MAAFDELPEDEKKLLQNRDILHRTAVAKIRAAVASAIVCLDDDKITGELIAKLGDKVAIPSISGLLGISQITAEDNKINLSMMGELIASWNTQEVRDRHVRYVGAINMDGQNG